MFADGRRIATFQPQGALCAFIQRTPLLAASQKWLKLATTWPFSEGRTPLTVCLFPLFGILAASMWGRRRKVDIPSLSRNLSCFGFGLAHRRRISRLPLRPYPRWMQIINVLLIVALFVAVTPTEVNAQTYNPVFYYYHGDHLGSSNILTDRDGNVVQHYEYTAFGKERFNEGCAFNVSHRYTGQIFDEATGLYYCNARYYGYDPELGRFIQPDTIVPSAGDPQTLNRYSYVRNNPLIYTDPSGHVFGIDDPIIAIAIGAAVGAASSAATGGNILRGLAMGAIGGLFGGLGAWGGSLIGSSWGWSFAGGIVGGAAGGASNAAIFGGNVGLAALSGAIGGAISGGLGAINLPDPYPFWASVGGGALSGGIGAELQGGEFWKGAAYGAGAAAAGFILADLAYQIKEYYNNPRSETRPAGSGPSQASTSREAKGYTEPIKGPIANLLGKIWTLPNTVLGIGYGLLNYPLGARVSFGDNAIEFLNAPLTVGEITFGNTVIYGRELQPSDLVRRYDNTGGPRAVRLGRHAQGHTWQYMRLGPLYVPIYLLSGGWWRPSPFEHAADDYGQGRY